MRSADKVGRFLVAVAREPIQEFDFRFVELNGAPALLVLSAGRPDSVFQLEVLDERIQCVYIVRNPDKLTSLTPT
jgi:RNA polymerase sigma-70 factor (ECF subfamily)